MRPSIPRNSCYKNQPIDLDRMTTGSKFEQSLTSTLLKTGKTFGNFVSLSNESNLPSKLRRVAMTCMENCLFAPLSNLSSVH